jgi:dTDP-4-dehydrorhamnose 3,5-epimerase
MSMSESSGSGDRIVLHPTGIAGVMEVELRPVRDARGQFTRIFEPGAFADTGLFPDGPVHVNVARTLAAGTVRGLHWQESVDERVGEAKLVFCITGRVFDVAVDLRPESATYLKHHEVELAPEFGHGLLIPPRVAHGMQALEDRSTLLYLHSAAFAPELERGALVDDPALAISWPLPVDDRSDRDRNHPSIHGESA